MNENRDKSMPFSSRVDPLLQKVEAKLLNAFEEDHWEGKLSSSALSTAVAVIALRITDEKKYADVIYFALDWLKAHANPDGGFGDTVDCPSNLSTTLLVWCAFSEERGSVVVQLEKWIRAQTGDLNPESIRKAVLGYYGDDNTFSVPILMTCALAGRLGGNGWKYVPQLPFELAVFPRILYRFLGLQVVSYALPALISIGWVRFHLDHNRVNPLNWIRSILRPFLFCKLKRIQPENGGFLEATPLTAFVVMSLAASGHQKCGIVEKGISFLLQSIRSDGSWSIDTHLATWLTSLSVNVLYSDIPHPEKINKWLKSQQGQVAHPFTGANPGGWAWTPFSGGVPDADDTSGALISLSVLEDRMQVMQRKNTWMSDGVHWLLNLQNRDGGMPTFCRGWGKLPFDCSSPDVTAHALHAFYVCRKRLNGSEQKSVLRAMQHGIRFLQNCQHEDGSWVPLWFGNPWSENQRNPVYGTSRVLKALSLLDKGGFQIDREMLDKGVHWLLKAQNLDGGWGSNSVGGSTIEETALAMEALADISTQSDTRLVLEAGLCFLEKAWGSTIKPTPIGLYFASLWYSEELYPVIFSLSALKSLKERCHDE
jgi:squalene-hopene/tetraprenyl-beta-curcumene cyclase